MNTDWNATQQAIFEEYRMFAQQNVAPRAQKMSAENTFDQQSWAKLCQSDFWKRIVPVAHGGSGENWWDFIAALEGLASGAQDGGFVLTLVSQAAFIFGLNQFGNEAQKEKYFPRLLQGALTATAIAEQHSGTDIGASKTLAQLQEDGSYRLNGKKWNISHAMTAELTLVVCKIPAWEKRDVAVFVVENAKKGVQAGPKQSKMGNRSIPTSWISFEDVELFENDLLGPPKKGLQTLGTTVSMARALDGWMGATLMQPILTKAMHFVQTRESQGKLLANHQYIQGRITDFLIGQQQSRLTGIAAIAQLLNGDPKAAMNCSIAKLTGAKAFLEAAQSMVQLFGSEGYLEGEMAHLLKDAIGFATVGGTEEMHKINIFNQFQRLFTIDELKIGQ